MSKIIKYKDLYSGINIITIFDAEQNKPLVERLIFNKQGIKQTELSSIESKIASDSINVSLQLKDKIDLKKLQNLSVYVLPGKTKSYTHNANILSQIYLPYVKGFIQNANCYLLLIVLK